VSLWLTEENVDQVGVIDQQQAHRRHIAPMSFAPRGGRITDRLFVIDK
jgi:hypothetical protein